VGDIVVAGLLAEIAHGQSSIMRWRSGLMGFSLMAVLEVEVVEPSILKTGYHPVTADAACPRR
jgi:hypothetical protein